MKKFLMNLILVLFINVLISVYLSGISIFNVVPAINLIFLIVYSVNSDRNDAILFGFIMGLIIDILYGTNVGFNTLLYMYVAISAHYISKRYLSSDPLVVLVLLLGAIFVVDITHFFFFLMFDGKTYIFSFIFKIIIPEMIYTSIVYIPLQFLVTKYCKFEKKII